MGGYMRNPRQVAAALRALADDVDAIGNVELAELSVSVSVQVVAAGAAAPGERVAAVDRIAAGLGTAADTVRLSSGGYYHDTRYGAQRHGVSVAVFTALPELTDLLTCGRSV